MISLTERYLAAALRSIPDAQRADVERELRSSIADAVEDRVAAGEERASAEKAVLEGLGEPPRLAAGYTGRPLYLIGPDVFLVYRHILATLVGVIVPIVAVVLTTVELAGGAGYLDGLMAGIGGAFSTGVHLAFWVTLTFVFLERAEVAREARSEMVAATGRWTVGRLPNRPAGRISLSETVGEVLMALLSIGGLLFLRDTAWFTTADGARIAVLDPGLSAFWFPALTALLVALAGLQIVVHLVGRWTMPLAFSHAGLQLAIAVPLVALALSGLLIDPRFAAQLGRPELARGDWPVMLILAAGVTLVTAWEIFDAFRRAHRARTVAMTTEA